jgi:N-dimethylarginine dimethylaminohydrolase
MSLVSPVAADMAVVYQPMMAVALVEDLRERGWRLIDIPEGEFETMGRTSSPSSPGGASPSTGTRRPAACWEAAGCEVHVYEGDQISHNRQGGPTCLTRRSGGALANPAHCEKFVSPV